MLNSKLSAYMMAALLLSSTAVTANSSKVQLSFRSGTLGQFIASVEEQTEFTFMLDKKVDQGLSISTHGKEAPLNDLLAQVMSDANLDYEIVGNHILLKAKQQALRKIKGIIRDGAGEAVIGANVVQEGTQTGTTSDSEGRFELEVTPDATLKVSYIGYDTQLVPVKGKQELIITLTEDTKSLDEVVVVGYGMVKKKDLTGAVGNVKGDELANRKTTQLSTSLQGAISGLTVTRDNSAPGATASIRVRGITTIGDTSPLVIVDGVPGDINSVNPNDVESISVLKDAASAAIYGSRAAAGVILVTTKRASENDLKLSYNFEYGWEFPTKQPEFVGIQRYLEMTNELRYNDNMAGGLYQTFSEDQVNNWVNYNKTDPNNYPITDWTDLILKSNAPRQSHIVTLAGGSKVVRTNASFTYDKTDGLYADRYYERYMLRVNNDFKINKYIEASLDFNFKRSKVHRPVFDPFYKMRIASPVYAAVWEDGRVAEGKSGANPYAIMKDGGSRDEWYNQLGGQARLDILPIDGLKLSGIVSPNLNFDKIKAFSLKAPYYLADDPNTLGGYFEDHTTTKLTENRNDGRNITVQALANYLKSFGEHDFNILVGYENFYSFNENLMAARDQYELSNYPYLDLGPLTYRDNSGSAYETAYHSYFGRLMYNYGNRYLFQANVRRDGSSRFHEDYRWGTFPSFSLGWVLSEESFMRKLDLDWLSFAKVRGSWGKLGNERIGNYPYQATIAFSNVLFYQNGQAVSELSAAQQKYALRNISWETTESFDVGLDLAFLNNRLRFTGDYYKKTTRDMLLALEIPDYVGYDNPDKNTGKMKTHGYDLEVSWNDKMGDWTYSASVNFSDFVSKMGDLGGTEFLGDQVKKQGSEFNEWYGYLSDGLFQNQEDVDNSPRINNNVKPGDVKYKDISGPDGVPDGKISPEYDRVLLGGSLPRYLYGANLMVGYKGFDFSVVFQGVGSQNVRLSGQMIEALPENWGNIPALLDGNYWSTFNTEEQNLQARYPRLTQSNKSNNQAMSDYWMFNGRYLRMKNITLGYSVPERIVKKATINQLRFYVSANDVFCLNNYPKGWDPEMGTSAYPITTSLLLGVLINF